MLFTALLTTIISAAAPAQSAAEAVQAADPPVRVSLDHKSYQPGEGAKVSVRPRDDGYLLVFHMDPDGRLRVLFPLDPGDDNFVRGDQDYDIRGRGDREEAFSVDAPSGQGIVYAALSRDPFRFDQFVRGDHWDYRVLGDSALERDPEAGLTSLVEAMSDGHHFDYDVVTYEVVRTIAGETAPVYTTFSYSYAPSRYYGYGWYDSWNDPWYWRPYGLYRPFGVYGSTFGFSVFFGRPYFHHFYRPYFYDPYFYDPFFYDSFFLRPRCFYGFYCYRNVYIFNRPTYITYYPGHGRYRFKPGSPGGGGGIGIPYRPRAGYLTSGRPTSPLFPVSQFGQREGGRRVVDVPRRVPDIPVFRGGTTGRRGSTQGERRTLELKGPERVVPREVTPLLREPRRVERPIPSVTPRGIVPRDDAGRREERRLEPRRPESQPMPPRLVPRDAPRRLEPRAHYEFRRPERRLDYAPRRVEPQRSESGRIMPRSFERGGRGGGAVQERRAMAPRGGGTPSWGGARRRP